MTCHYMAHLSQHLSEYTCLNLFTVECAPAGLKNRCSRCHVRHRVP